MTPVPRRALLRAGFGVGLGFALGSSLAGRDDSQTARPILVWALDPAGGVVRSGSRLNQLLVVRLDPESLAAETKARSAEGVVAYTAICTHEGCAVDDWIGDAQLLYCPCHGSTYDPKDGARVVEGEAPRALPALPLKIENGKLQIAGPLTSRVGFQTA